MPRTGLLGWATPMGLILPPPRHLPPLARIVGADRSRDRGPGLREARFCRTPTRYRTGAAQWLHMNRVMPIA